MKFTYKHTAVSCYLGYITQAIINNLAPLFFIIFQQEFGISFEMIGRLILINFGTQIAADFFAIKVVDKIGIRASFCLAHVFCVIGLMSLSVLPKLLPNPYFGLVLAVMIYALGGGLLEVLVSPIVESLPGEEKASSMSLLHSFYCWGQVLVVLVTTLALWIFGSGIWYIIPLCWAFLPFFNIFFFIKVPLVPAMPEHEKTPLKQLFSSKIFVIGMLLMLCAGAAELTMSQWSSLFAEKGQEVSKVMGDLLGPCLFAVLMGIGRTIYGVWGSRINLENALIACGLLCVLCYLVTAFVQIPVISLIGCAVCGFSVSLMWPGTFSLLAKHYPKGGTAMFGILAVMGDMGAAIGPWMAGLVSDAAQKSSQLIEYGQKLGLHPDQIGLKTGILLGTVFPLLLFIGVLALKRFYVKQSLGTEKKAA